MNLQLIFIGRSVSLPIYLPVCLPDFDLKIYFDMDHKHLGNTYQELCQEKLEIHTRVLELMTTLVAAARKYSAGSLGYGSYANTV